MYINDVDDVDDDDDNNKTTKMNILAAQGTVSLVGQHKITAGFLHCKRCSRATIWERFSNFPKIGIEIETIC